MQKLLTALLFFFILYNLYPNDSRIMNTGNETQINVSADKIKIEKETINIYLNNNNYRIEVEYLYNNESDHITIEIGFPIFYSLHVSEIDLLDNITFSSYFNDIELKTIEVENDIKDSASQIQGIIWFKRKANFNPGINKSKIIYSSNYSQYGFTNIVKYLLETATTWHSTIRELEVIIHMDSDVVIKDWNIASFNKNNIPPAFSTTDDGFYFKLINYEPILNENIFFVIDFFSMEKKYNNVFGSYADGWIWYSDFIFENKNEIWLFSKSQIQMYINFFYAYRGYLFKNTNIFNYFINSGYLFMDEYNTKYTPNKSFSENYFNTIEKENINYLISLRKRLYGF